MDKIKVYVKAPWITLNATKIQARSFWSCSYYSVLYFFPPKSDYSTHVIFKN